MNESDRYNELDPVEIIEQAEEMLPAEKIPQPDEPVAAEAPDAAAETETNQSRFAALRKESNVQGGALLIYHVIMNVVVLVVMFAVTFVLAFALAFSGGIGSESEGELVAGELMDSVMGAAGWGYLLAVAIGLVTLLLWKKPGYIRHTIWQKGKPMTIAAFFALLSLTMSAQMVAQIGNLGLYWLLEAMGLDGGALDELANVDTDSLGMFLYIGIAAPITEELLFRGLLLRSIAPHNKKLAVIGSAILFGLYHGNPIQTPYAILVGLVLGYVALEYHVIWAIAFHLFNNLVFALLLPEVLSFLPVAVIDGIMWASIIAFFAAGVVILVVKRRELAMLSKQEPMELWQRHAFFRAPTIVVLIVLCLINTVGTTLLLFLQ